MNPPPTYTVKLPWPVIIITPFVMLVSLFVFSVIAIGGTACLIAYLLHGLFGSGQKRFFGKGWK